MDKKRFALGAGLLVVAIACGDSAVNTMGETMEDIGERMQGTGGAQAQQSKSVSCDKQATINGNPWFDYALVDVGDARFPDVTVRVTYQSWEDLYNNPGNPQEYGLAAGGYVSHFFGSQFIDGKLLVSCNGTEESITVYY